MKPLGDLDPILKLMVRRQASDLFVTAGLPPSLRIQGTIHALSREALSPEGTRETVRATMTEAQQREFDIEGEANFALSRSGIGRFRVSAFRQRGQAGMVVRRIESKVPTLEELGLPPVVADWCGRRRGLVLVVGGAGSGKSTTLAAMVEHRNQNGRGHILTVEDPIEYMHRHGASVVTQREVGLDTDDYPTALRNALRQSPDVVVIGEIRSPEVMDYALGFAETGHLCLATLHATTADQALERILNFFPEKRHRQVRMDLAMHLHAVLAQQLVPTRDEQGRVPATEALVRSPRVEDLIRRGHFDELKEVMARLNQEGMHTFDQSLLELQRAETITAKMALAHADSPHDLRLSMRLEGGDESLGEGLEVDGEPE
ncbi:twitching motility protein PilU [Thiohalospira halophila DSM 15071]|uniref:Twitching motility protein PilU n=1 Tax=Thiohalospira halophila DSM 15071 TaxID=1123397 RepID=A0A1I1SIV8_9GAMM|nr:PilT/PilU family type 4a pilus ATPase [Thiohalospira halophila]SFD46371.1 twitching motility protein PilU [Thiohalospira halophila DSM 15071]